MTTSLVHRFSADRYFLCVNASNAEKDFDWICDHNTFEAEVVYVSDQYSQLALQGPKALKILQPWSTPIWQPSSTIG